jgi:L-ribulose-5-phosphate 4-epimerase
MTARDDAIAALREEVCRANVELWRRGLATFTFGNASAMDREHGVIVIKPSGVPYSDLRPDMLVVTDVNGTVIDGALRASSDLPTHVVLYGELRQLGGIVHTHSHYTTVWAQSRREIPCLGTTHADYFHGPVPITRDLAGAEIRAEYEENTGRAIVRRFSGLDPMRVPAVLVAGHASFCWGASVGAAVETASVLEEIARLAFETLALNAAAEPLPVELLDKHFYRKHGPSAYYGQPPLEAAPATEVRR